ncbi:hypothetical protein CF128_17200 [Aeromonas veronii]|nr:hypothetical protein CF128_17200 [Aeromonas veronii]
MKKATVPVVAAASLMAAPAFADTKTAIEEAIKAGQENYGLVTAGVIGVAALGFALGMIVSWLRK